MKRFLTILFSCLFTVSLYGYAPTDYYVSNSGSDSNDGLSSSTSKSRPEQITLSSNDAIYYERDGVWDSVAVAYTGLSDITIGAYGTGAKPIITCYDTLDYVSVSSNIYKFNHPLLEVDYYFHMPYTSRGTWKRFENNYGWLLDNDRNHYEMGRYQTAGTYSKLTTYSESDNTYFECLSLVGSESDNYHNGSSGKVQVDAWWTEAFLVGDYTDASGAFSISNLISASTYNLSSDYDHQMYLYNHTNYLDEDNEWASNDGTSTRDGDIWIYNSSDISGDNYFLPIDSAVFSLLNCSNVRISDLELQGGHQAAITAYGCDSMVYDSLMFKNVHCGVFSDDGGDQYYRYDSVMYSTNYGLFTQQGYNINIENYYAYDIGTSEGGGGDGDVSFDAIFVRFPDDSAKVSYSHIDSCGRNGIHFKGNTSGLVYKVTNTHVEKYLTGVQDGAAIYFSGSPGTTTDKYIRNCITSKGQYANDDFHCRSTTNHSGIYLDTDQEGTIIDSNTVIDAIIGIKLNGTYYNTIRNNTVIRATQWGISYVDYNFGYGGLGSSRDTIHNNIIVNNDTNAYGIRYLAYTAIDGLDSYSDTNTFVNVQDATDQNINREINYSPSACSVPDWATITEGYLGAGNAWEDESFVNFTNHFASVSGSIDTDQCVVGIANATESEQTINLYDLTFYRADSIEMSGSITIQPYKGVELIYKSGTASNIDLLPYIIREDINEEAGLNYNRASRRIRYKGIQYKILYNNKLFEVWYGNPINITNDLRAVDAGTDAVICSDSTLQLIGTVSGTYDSLRWSSLTLDNDSLITPTNDSCNYTPAPQDISDGSGYVRLTVYNDDLTLIDSVNIDNYNCDSLIAYYPFTGNAGDSSGNGYDGIVNGATLTTDRAGSSNSAYTFDGTNDTIDLTVNDYSITNQLTISLWSNASSSTCDNWGKFFKSDEIHLQHQDDNTYCGVRIDCDYANQTEVSTSPYAIVDDLWHHIVITLGVDDSVKLYRDATLVDYDLYNLDGCNSILNNFMIGGSGSSNEWYGGKIDEVKIFNEELSQSTITTIYNEYPNVIASSDTLIYPDAVGFGAESRGAYDTTTVTDPVILYVDTLLAGDYNSDATHGSLEWALTYNGARIVIFEVSGVIDYTASSNTSTTISNPYINIYGQTAQDNGITLLGHELYVETHDVLIQHIKFRQYDKNTNSYTNRCVGVIAGAYNVVFDHCSFSFANDEVFTIWGAEHDITLSNSIVSFPLHENNSYTDNAYDYPAAHGFPVIDDADTNIAYINNLICYGVYRNPLSQNDKMVVQNNYTYVVDERGVCGVTFQTVNSDGVVIIKNNEFHHKSTETWVGYAASLTGDVNSSAEIWVEGNNSTLLENNPSYTQWQTVFNSAGCSEPSSTPFDTTAFSSIPTDSVIGHITAFCGAYRWDRDIYDQMAIDSALTGSFDYINSADSLPARAYNRSQYSGLETNAGNMSSGYDFSGANNVSFTVNGTTIDLTTDLSTDIAAVLSAINGQMPTGYEAVQHANPDCPFIILQSEDLGSGESIVIGGDASIFGIPNGTFYGEDGIGGYPNDRDEFEKADASWTLPTNPHDDDNGNGYTNIEDWANGLANP